MNIRNLLTTLIGAIVFLTPAVAQHGHGAQPKDPQKQRDMSDMMGKPVLEQTTDGLTIRVWLITQNEHKKMMKDQGMIGGARKDRHEMMGMMHGNSAEKGDRHVPNEQTQHQADGMNEETMKLMLAGTHHIIVIVQDEASNTEQGRAQVEVQVTSPTGKDSLLTLTRMMKHYGGGLTLLEPGKQRIKVVARDGDRVVQASFDYGVSPNDQ